MGDPEYAVGMELRHLRYFVAVAEEQNITRAASRLHVSQPPLSRQIRDLESELGVKLFDRSAKAVHLTDAGRMFLLEARSVLERANEAVGLIKAVALGRRGRLRVGYAASPTVEILPLTMRSFLRTHPKMTVDLREMSTQGMLRGLREHTLDVALIVAISPREFAGLTVELLGSYPVCIAVHRKHRFAKVREVRLSEVAGEPLVTFSRLEYPEAYAGLLKILSPYTRSPKIVEEYDGAASLIAAVEAGRGAALVFQSLSLLAGQRVVLRPLKPTPPPLPIAVAYLKDGLSAATAAFVAAARAVRVKQGRSSRHLVSPLEA
jgi:DNA-binding transcriptional LysR family regulator